MLIFRGVTCTTCPPAVPQIVTIIFKKTTWFPVKQRYMSIATPAGYPAGTKVTCWAKRKQATWWNAVTSPRVTAVKVLFWNGVFFHVSVVFQKKSVCLNCSFFLIETSSNPFLGIRLPLPCKWIGVVPERFLDGVCALFPLGALPFITEVFTTIVSPLLELLFSPFHQQSFCVLGCFFPTTISSWILWMPAYACYPLPAFFCWYVCLFWL